MAAAVLLDHRRRRAADAAPAGAVCRAAAPGRQLGAGSMPAASPPRLERSIPGRAYCSARSGAPASARRSARPPCSRRARRIWRVVALTMIAFGIGTALPLLAIGMMSREALAALAQPPAGGRQRRQGGDGRAAARGRRAHPHRPRQAARGRPGRASPAWLTELTTRFYALRLRALGAPHQSNRSSPRTGPAG